MNTREELLGFPVTAEGVDECVDELMSWLVNGDSCRILSCFNPHSYVLARKDHTFRSALRSAAWLVPDGAGILLASRLLGGHLRERVTGSDIFQRLHERLDTHRGSVFLLGATEDTLNLMTRRLNADFPGVRVLGTYTPPFKAGFSQEDSAPMVAAVNRVCPDVLWVGMTSPKQDIWLYANRNRLEAKVGAAVGAVFDFYSGRVQRPSAAWQRAGLEWLPRLVIEPRRLWRRTLISTPLFVLAVLHARLHIRTQSSGGAQG